MPSNCDSKSLTICSATVRNLSRPKSRDLSRYNSVNLPWQWQLSRCELLEIDNHPLVVVRAVVVDEEFIDPFLTGTSEPIGNDNANPFWHGDGNDIVTQVVVVIDDARFDDGHLGGTRHVEIV
jgi:hypothetical protein